MAHNRAVAKAGARGRDEEPRLSIGALSRATGIPVETLRTWESRYGFPVPERKPSGHRVYPLATVERLRQMSAAVAGGHRPAEVVGKSEAALARFLGLAQPVAPARPEGPEELLALVAALDGDRLTRALLGDWARLDPIVFLEGRIAPLLTAAGEAWAAGGLAIRHEHFLSARVGDLLRALRLRFEERARGPRVVFATLPGEAHVLGLEMAALAAAVAGVRVVGVGGRRPAAGGGRGGAAGLAGVRVGELGPPPPAEEVAEAARAVDARAVAISVSAARSSREVRPRLEKLKRRLGPGVALLLGGRGAPRGVEGVVVFADLGGLHAFAARLGD